MSPTYKILFFPMDGIGHINACIGLAQALNKRGHQIVFLTTPMFTGGFEKFGFKEYILLTSRKEGENEQKKDNNEETKHPLENNRQMLMSLKERGILSGKESIDKLSLFDPDEEHNFMKKLYLDMAEFTPQIDKIIKDENPDLIIFDHFILSPIIAFGDKPYAFLFSGNPLFMLDDNLNLPPPTSGYPIDDQSKWQTFRDVYKKNTKLSFNHFQNELNKTLGYPEPNQSNALPLSPYLNIYGYPEELDYTDVIEMPKNFARCDAFYRDVPEKFELPDELKSKMKPGDKLIYISMGSMGSIDVDLMKKLTNALASTPHKYIVSKGPLGGTYDLPDNMWGQSFLPQTKILPLVDLVLTHGGNNTVTETFVHGKPMLIMPLFGDQYDNAQRITEKGYGGRFNGYNCTDEELRAEVDRILNDQQILERCKKAAERMAKTDSKEKLCQIIEDLIADKK